MQSLKHIYLSKFVSALTAKAIFYSFIVVSPSSWAESSITVIHNALVWTGNPAQPWAETIVIAGNRIEKVGGKQLANDYALNTSGHTSHDDVHLNKARTNSAQVIDAQGRLVVPGFIDNHTHFMDGASSLISVKTQGSTSKRQFSKTIKAYAKSIPKGEWITGGLWDHESWGGQLPSKHWIDRHTKSNPLFLLRTDGHMAIANSRALQLAGITRDTPDPPGGLIVRDRRGEPTGVLKDNAMNPVFKAIPTPSAERARQTFDAGINEGLRNGVTQIHNMSNWDNIALFENAKAEGRLRLRTYYFPHISNRHKLAMRIKTHGRGDNWLRFGGVKELVDGSLGSTTAWFYEPYSDEPETNGFPLMTMAELRTSLEEAHGYGLQLAIHGIGDQANDKILDLFESLEMSNARPRIEHAQHLSKSAVSRFAELNVVASMHPYHAIDDGRWAEKRIGAERLDGTYAFNSLFSAGAKVSFGSDWSVAPLNPISGIYAAVTRRTLDGQNPDGWVAHQKITVEQALQAYTVNNAWAGMQEQDLGSIEAGKLADIVMLSRNLFEIPPEEIIDTTVVLTIIDGQIAFDAR